MKTQGIDYGMGQANIDKKTGIRFGVISSHSLNPDVIYDVMSDGADYGKPACPKCGNEAIANDADCEACNESENLMLRKDYHCHVCGPKDPTKFDGCVVPIYCFWSDRAFGDEPVGWAYDQDGYRLTDCLQNDVFVLESPFYAYAAFCSPCVPGAGNLDSPIQFDGPVDAINPMGDWSKVYCLNHDWFEESKAPYRVFRVSDNTEVPCE